MTDKKPTTDITFRNLKKRESIYDVLDSRAKGLSMRVSPDGLKTWNVRYSIDGKARRMRIGHYPHVSLADARAKHALIRAAVERGEDPAATEREAAIARRRAPTFSDLLHEFHAHEIPGKPFDEALRMVLKDCGEIMDLKLKDITRRDLVLLLDEVGDRAPVLRNRLQGALNKIFTFATDRGLLESNPAFRIRRLPETSRSRVLTDAEIKALWTALESTTTELYALTRLSIKAILLTAQRPGEVAGMRWTEISDGIWTLPASRSKTGKTNQTPILPMFNAVLERARFYSSDSEYVFRSSRMDNAPVNVCALAAAVRRHKTELGMAAPPWTPHDLRRTVRTRLAALSVSVIVGEKLLNHSLGGVLAVYDRHDYVAEKRVALAKWERRLQEMLGMVEPEKVVVQFPG